MWSTGTGKERGLRSDSRVRVCASQSEGACPRSHCLLRDDPQVFRFHPYSLLGKKGSADFGLRFGTVNVTSAYFQCVSSR